MTETLITVILVFMIIAAAVALSTKELLSSVISVGAVGFGGSIAYLLMRSPDLAITQVVVEVVSLVLLIRVTVGMDLKLSSGRSSLRRLAAGTLSIFVLFFLFVLSLRNFPPFGAAVMDRIASAPSLFYIDKSLPLTGSPNIITGILLDFRAYDTLGEATVIFTAVLGGLALLRKKGRIKKEENPY